MSELEPRFEVSAKLNSQSSYGENPWQARAGLYMSENGQNDPLSLANFNQVSGAALSYNNYCDVDRLLQTVTHIAAGYDVNFGSVPHIAAGAKHGNVCGVGIGQTKEEALQRMLDGDRRAIFGGSVMANFALQEDEAEVLMRYGVEKGKRLLDVVVAEEFDEKTQEMLARKGGKLRLLTNKALGSLSVSSLDSSLRTRYVRGGLLVQDNYTHVLDLSSAEVHEGGRAPKERERDVVLAWAIGSTSNSNTVTLVREGQLIGNGVGQQDRVSAAELAIKRASDAGHNLEDSVAYSDSFFPFPDGPQKLIDVGVSAIFSSSGSVQDDNVFKTITSSGVKLYTIPDREGRGFYAH